MVEFKEWPKIPRGGKGNEKITITEKIDGSNGCIIIENGVIVGVQSRNRMLASLKDGTLTREGDDNFGFAHWVIQNQNELLSLEDGYHYGEWAGPGIQNNPHKLENKTFFLFNALRWNPNNPNTPAITRTVPVLYQGLDKQGLIDEVMLALKAGAAEKDYKAEGIVVYYQNTKRLEKYTFEFSEGKWKNESN